MAFEHILFKHGLLARSTLQCTLLVKLIQSSGLQVHPNVAGVDTTSSEGRDMTRRKNKPQREHNENTHCFTNHSVTTDTRWQFTPGQSATEHLKETFRQGNGNSLVGDRVFIHNL